MTRLTHSRLKVIPSGERVYFTVMSDTKRRACRHNTSWTHESLHKTCLHGLATGTESLTEFCTREILKTSFYNGHTTRGDTGAHQRSGREVGWSVGVTLASRLYTKRQLHWHIAQNSLALLYVFAVLIMSQAMLGTLSTTVRSRSVVAFPFLQTDSRPCLKITSARQTRATFSHRHNTSICAVAAQEKDLQQARTTKHQGLLLHMCSTTNIACVTSNLLTEL